MAPRWKLTVDGLGRIEHAEVDVRPLTLFVGPNNSGKSYLASLLWGLVAMQGDSEAPEGPEREAADAWIRARLPKNGEPVRVELSPDDANLFAGLFRVALDAGSARLVRRIFNAESMQVGKVSFRNASLDAQLALDVNPHDGPWYRIGVGVRHDISSVTSIARQDEQHVEQTAVERTRSLLAQYATFRQLAWPWVGFDNTFHRRHPVYLPASRTGFMRLYKAAVRRSFRDASRRDAGDRQELELTTPESHFIDMMAFGLQGALAPTYIEEAGFLERYMSGRVELVTGPGTNEYRYHPKGAASPLPMQLSSALITELLPLVLALRHLEHFPAVVLEEPEAHLHPELQRRVAQVVVRLVRKGVCVWVTTHSENFCQYINDFLKLGALPEEKRREAQAHLGYDPQDYLTLDDVSGYELRPDAADLRTEVVEMKRTEAGLVMPTFNKAIVRLSKEVAYLDDLLADAGE